LLALKALMYFCRQGRACTNTQSVELCLLIECVEQRIMNSSTSQHAAACARSPTCLSVHCVVLQFLLHLFICIRLLKCISPLQPCRWRRLSWWETACLLHVCVFPPPDHEV
jgi:hypothetical protein